MKIKMIAIDLDGTLWTDDKKISQRNKEVLQKAKDQGVKVVITTGRPVAAIHHYLEELNLLEEGDYAITFNGGLVQKNDTGEILAKKTLNAKEVHRLYDLVHPTGLPIDVISDHTVFQLPSMHPTWYMKDQNLCDKIPSQLADIDDSRFYNKAVSCYEQEMIDAHIDAFKQALDGEFEVVKSRDILLEYLPKGVTKAYGLQGLCDLLGFTMEEVMSLGDEENDLPMIKAAGLGVAMANAIPEVKAVAKVETLTNMEDGVAAAVEKYVWEEEK